MLYQAMPNYEKFLSKKTEFIEGSPLARILLRMNELSKAGNKIISFAAGDPDPNVIPREDLSKISEEIISNIPSSVLYTPSIGLEELRDEISKFIAIYDGINAEKEDIIVTGGSTIAIDLLSRILIDQGDHIIVENPTYINSLLAFKQLGANLIGVNMDNEGLVVSELEKELKELSGKVKFIYTIPTCQNPSGITLSLERRKQLLEIASKYDLLILEDTAYNYLYFGEEKLPTLKSLDREGRVIVTGTLSKIMGTGFRIGWLIAQEDIKRLIIAEKQQIEFCPPTISQYVALEFLKRRIYEKSIERAKRVYKEKLNKMMDAISQRLPNAKFHKPQGGMFIMLELPNINAEKLAIELLEKKFVATIPAKKFHVYGGENRIRLNFSRPSLEEIEEGIRRISEFFMK